MKEGNGGKYAAIKTVFFRNCLGVFQGGGCRVVAHAGAYKAASDAGVFFSEVAGTSAGAIVAALIGAGAKPQFILDEISRINFPSLLCPPERNNEPPNRPLLLFLRLLALFPGFKVIIDPLRYGGCYSSSGIETVVDNLLSKLLPDVKRRITFNDLLLPTYVVATDLCSNKPRIFSKIETPNESVAFAVRASCSIPGFFQPVINGNTRLVDGGMLSNLPTFVFSEGHDFETNGRRILAFRLEERFDSISNWTSIEIFRRIINIVISGATELQANIHKDVHSISIPTGAVKATDFRTINQNDISDLIKSGEQTTLAFIKSEAIHLRQSREKSSVYLDKNEVYSELVQQSELPPREIIILEQNTDWYWRLVPSVFYWRYKYGTRIRVLLLEAQGDSEERKRENLRRTEMRKLGVELHVVPQLPFKGFLFFREDTSGNEAIIYQPTEEGNGPIATLYRGPSQQSVIQVMEKLARMSLSESASSHDPQPTPRSPLIKSSDRVNLCRLLKKVKQYTNENVLIDILPIEVEKIRIKKLIEDYKYQQAAWFYDLYSDEVLNNESNKPFSPVEIIPVDGTASILTCPPVVEIWGGEYIAIKGHSRIFHCWKKGIEDKITCVVVRGLGDSSRPPRCEELRKATIVTSKFSIEKSIPGWSYDHFRSIETAIRPIEG